MLQMEVDILMGFKPAVIGVNEDDDDANGSHIIPPFQRSSWFLYLFALKMSLWSYEADVINLFFSFFFSGEQIEEELIARLPGSTLTVRRNV